MTDKDLVAAIKTSVGVDVDRHSLRAPIMKKLGSYSGKINIHSTVVANISIQVVAAE